LNGCTIKGNEGENTGTLTLREAIRRTKKWEKAAKERKIESLFLPKFEQAVSLPKFEQAVDGMPSGKKGENMGSLYCLDVGFGDASIIITSTATFLIDCLNIGDFSHLLPTTKTLRGVFITHQHADHYSGLQYLKDQGYTIEHLIYSPYSRRRGDNSVTLDEWNEFNELKDYFVTEGTKIYAPYRQIKFGGEAWWSPDGLSFEIIGPHSSTADSETREIHDASLVIKAILGNRKCLFTGDASDANLEYIASNTNNVCNDILHASHHGSFNGASLDFIKKCNAKYTLISTKSGVYDNVPDATALRRYKDNTEHDVRRTDVDGTWKWDF
jgi:beta-lactamase superfamily II metal-dependent hydrolase